MGFSKSQNPFTAKGAKKLRKGRKGLWYMDLTLRSLRILCVLCGLKLLFQQPIPKSIPCLPTHILLLSALTIISCRFVRKKVNNLNGIIIAY
jgi:hypothetical protein